MRFFDKIQKTVIPGFCKAHLPYVSFSIKNEAPKLGIRYGNYLIPLGPLAQNGFAPKAVDSSNLDEFLKLPYATWRELRVLLQNHLLGDKRNGLFEELYSEDNVIHVNSAELHPPLTVQELSMFTCSEPSVTNSRKFLRPGSPPSSGLHTKGFPRYYPLRRSLVTFDPSVKRPITPINTMPKPKVSRFGPAVNVPINIELEKSSALDFETHLAYISGGDLSAKQYGVDFAVTKLFGLSLAQRFVARDTEEIEVEGSQLNTYAVKLSHYITPFDAVVDYQLPKDKSIKQPAHLTSSTGTVGRIDMAVETVLNGTPIHKVNTRHLSWGPFQLLSHLSPLGVGPGEVILSGTISGPEVGTLGSMLEITEHGERQHILGEGVVRRYLLDDDVISLSASCKTSGLNNITLPPLTTSVSS